MNAQATEPSRSNERGSTFRHERLRHSNEIRLIQLLPGRRGTAVQCRLLHIRLDDTSTPQYTAISYVWGSQTQLLPVECEEGGGSVWVTQNCHAALCELRDYCSEGLYWIDAISIDQTRTTERNHQVLLMKQIYSNAAKVLTYLGDGPLRITALLRRIKPPIRQREDLKRLSGQICGSPMGDTRTLSELWTADDTEKIILFLRHPYWRRMWIVQEIFAATRLEIMYNGEVFDESLIRGIVSIRSSVLGTALWFPLPLTTLIRDPASNWQWDLWTLLSFTAFFSTSDMRDRVIALLGVAERTDVLLKELLADYAGDTDELFQRLIVYFFMRAIGMHPCEVFTDLAGLRRILDSSHLRPSSADGLELEHVLDLELSNTSTSQDETDVVGANHRAVMVSATYSRSQLEGIWCRSHSFLDRDLLFQQVVSFGSMLREDASIDVLATSPGNLPAFNEQEDNVRLAATVEGRLYAVDPHFTVGSRLEPQVEPVVLSSAWKLRCSDPLHHTRIHKTCCSHRNFSQIGIEWLSTAPKQIDSSHIWQSNEATSEKGRPLPRWLAAQGADSTRMARKRSFAELSGDF